MKTTKKFYRFRCLTFRGRDTTYTLNAVSNLQAVQLLISMIQVPSEEMSESAEWIVSVGSDDMLVSWSELCIWAVDND